MPKNNFLKNARLALGEDNLTQYAYKLGLSKQSYHYSEGQAFAISFSLLKRILELCDANPKKLSRRRCLAMLAESLKK